jgi:MOSC domain-containing protein YiiM
VAHLEQIWIKRVRLGPMDSVDRAAVAAGQGIVGNANQRGRRQVTLLSREHWTAITRNLPAPDPVLRRANLLLSGIDLVDSRGKVLQIGPVRVRVLGETRPCERMDEALPGLRAALSVPWGGGAFGEVLDDGELIVGDPARWSVTAAGPAEENPPRSSFLRG